MTKARLTPKGQTILLDNIGKSNLAIIQVGAVMGVVVTCCWNTVASTVASTDPLHCGKCGTTALDIKGYAARRVPVEKLAFALRNNDKLDKQVAMFRFALSHTLHILPAEITLTVSFD